jgi:O-glycosyl hydrolase
MVKAISFLLTSAFCCSLFALDVDVSKKIREIDGFGASSAWYSDEIQAMPQATRDELIDFLFDSTKGIGLSILRNRIDPDILVKNSSGYDWTDIEPDIWLMKQVRMRGCSTFISAPWSPPGWMKTNNNSQNGGSLKEGFYSQWAEALADYANKLDSEGTRLYALSVQNEPKNKQPWETCVWTDNTFYDFVKNHMIPAFQQKNVDTRIMAGEEWKWSEDIVVKLLDDESTRPHIDIVAAHEYKKRAFEPLPKAKKYNKKVWMTEDSEESGTGIGEALIWAEHVHVTLTEGEANAFLYWWLVAKLSKGSNASLTRWNHDETDFSVFKRAYTFGNYSRFVRPGYFLVESPLKPQSGVRTAAFASADQKTLALVVVNSSGSSYSTTVNISGLDTEKLTPYRTSDSDNLKKLDDVAVNDNQASVTVPKRSVVTFVGVAGNATSTAAHPAGEKQAVTSPGADIHTVVGGGDAQPAQSNQSEARYDLQGKVMPQPGSGATPSSGPAPAGVYIRQR